MWWPGMLTGTGLRRTTCSASASNLTCASSSSQTDTRQASQHDSYLCHTCHHCTLVYYEQHLGRPSYGRSAGYVFPPKMRRRRALLQQMQQAAGLQGLTRQSRLIRWEFLHYLNAWMTCGFELVYGLSRSLYRSKWYPVPPMLAYAVLTCLSACSSFVAVQWAGEKARTCEDLKERYYRVARSLQVAWEGSEEGAANLTLVKHPFNAQHERCAAHPLRYTAVVCRFPTYECSCGVWHPLGQARVVCWGRTPAAGTSK